MHLFLWCLSMSFCRIMIKTCFLVTNHVLEITLFLLYIVNLSLMSITALIHSPCPKTQTSVFVWKMFKDTEKNTHYFSIRLNTRDCVLYSVDIFSRFPDSRKLYGHTLLLSLFCVGFQRQLAVFLSWFPVQSWQMSIHFIAIGAQSGEHENNQ